MTHRPKTHRLRSFFLSTALMGSLLPGLAAAQFGELNLLTDLGTPFPPGCLSIDIPNQPESIDSLLVDSDLEVPAIPNSANPTSDINVRIWRVACADEGYSVVLVRLQQIAGAPVVVPQVYAQAGDVAIPLHEAQLLRVPGAGPGVGASGNIVTTGGTTFMLAVDPVPLAGDSSFLPVDYNEQFTLEFAWDAYSGASNVFFPVLLDRFEPSLDPPQFESTVLNGRYTGQWVADGRERQGLVLQIAERQDSNFLFAIFFTYLNGQPFWVTGNTAASSIQPGPITVNALRFENGAFIADPNQPARPDIDQVSAGSFTIEAIDCNTLRVDYDFSPLGQGTGSIVFTRLVRVAGYDCNPWEQDD